MTFINELDKAKEHMMEMFKQGYEAFDVTSTARVFEALKEQVPQYTFEGPIQEMLPAPHSKGAEEYTFVVARSNEAYLRHEEER